MTFEQSAIKFLSILNSLTPDERDIFERKVLVVHAIYGTTVIEGTRLDEAEVEKVINGAKSPRWLEIDAREVRNMLTAMRYVRSMLSYPLTEQLIKNIQSIVVHGVEDEIAGQYRIVPVRVGRFKPVDLKLVPEMMKKLVEGYNEQTGDPLLTATIFHETFERIHPFRNGNGRTGRLIFNWMMERNGLPPLVLSLDDIDDYYDGLLEAGKGLGYNRLYGFFERCYEVLADKIDLFKRSSR